MSKYKKKHVVIEAIQWTGRNIEKLKAFCPVLEVRQVVILKKKDDFDGYVLTIPTLEGEMTVKPNAFIIRGVAGEFYACDEAIFYETYEPLA
ncbi:hypothetical protein NHG33_06620 [Aerococcaceae bacterium NML130460]|nr:hypothetical protein [Aerococcaceae bacterium NML130460]